MSAGAPVRDQSPQPISSAIMMTNDGGLLVSPEAAATPAAQTSNSSDCNRILRKNGVGDGTVRTGPSVSFRAKAQGSNCLFDSSGRVREMNEIRLHFKLTLNFFIVAWACHLLPPVKEAAVRSPSLVPFDHAE